MRMIIAVVVVVMGRGHNFVGCQVTYGSRGEDVVDDCGDDDGDFCTG